MISQNFACGCEMSWASQLLFLWQTGSRYPISEVCEFQLLQCLDCSRHVSLRILADLRLHLILAGFSTWTITAPSSTMQLVTGVSDLGWLTSTRHARKSHLAPCRIPLPSDSEGGQAWFLCLKIRLGSRLGSGTRYTADRITSFFSDLTWFALS